MDRVLEVFLAIRNDPENYLPERTIWCLRDFLTAYSRRVLMEGQRSDLSRQFSLFGEWLEGKFELGKSSHSIFGIVESYSLGPEHAIGNLYSLFDDFRKSDLSSPCLEDRAVKAMNKQELFEVLRAIRRRPPLYVVHPNLAGVASYLSGHQKAATDLGYPRTADEEIFDRFKAWVERDKLPGGAPRPWFKRIKFTCFHDCGPLAGSAYAVFFELLDEFSIQIDRPGLFDAELLKN